MYVVHLSYFDMRNVLYFPSLAFFSTTDILEQDTSIHVVNNFSNCCKSSLHVLKYLILPKSSISYEPLVIISKLQAKKNNFNKLHVLFQPLCDVLSCFLYCGEETHSKKLGYKRAKTDLIPCIFFDTIN